jgi:hypothetical protein
MDLPPLSELISEIKQGRNSSNLNATFRKYDFRKAFLNSEGNMHLRGPTYQFRTFLLDIVQHITTTPLQPNELRNLEIFLFVELEENQITGVIHIENDPRYKMYAVALNKYFTEDELKYRFGENKPFTISNSDVVFLIQKVGKGEEVPHTQCPHGSGCYRKESQMGTPNSHWHPYLPKSASKYTPIKTPPSKKVRSTPYSRGGKTRRRRSNRNHTKIRKRHRNL